MPQVYCAGPLFSASERQEMTDIAQTLEAGGYSTFLPHRDGLEFARLLPELQLITATQAAADAILQKAIFSLDVYQLIGCSDAVVANINGRVPDEGTIVEAALAWLAGKPVVLYKNDVRTVLSGSDHPMLVALGEFRIVREIAVLPQIVGDELRNDRKDRVQNILEMGKKIAQERRLSRCSVAAALVTLIAK